MENQYIMPLAPGVERTPVRYQNRYGMDLAGELYAAKDMDQRVKHPAVIVGAPYGGVKEQGPCVYANELAKRGFVVLTFDQSFMGESGGGPRHVSSLRFLRRTSARGWTSWVCNPLWTGSGSA